MARRHRCCSGGKAVYAGRVNNNCTEEDEDEEFTVDEELLAAWSPDLDSVTSFMAEAMRLSSDSTTLELLSDRRSLSMVSVDSEDWQVIGEIHVSQSWARSGPTVSLKMVQPSV
ncbi:hypothetical protein F7725_010745 [Dissostichus mawsoni]|uniref:Uncharacterized protein n=1 Tax=Dissostichus mawsoni TaxID=36200 RepID=A0A7J5Z6X9_DISMA|nr:hypothetical protein F7725_010745 [Dissostichus mawsoni]